MAPDPAPAAAAAEPFTLPELTGELAPGLRPDDLAAELGRLLDPAAAVETLHWGRNYLYRARLPRPPWPAAAPAEVVVKQFRTTGARARWRRRLSGSKAAKSWRVARAMLAAGVATPEPVMVAESRRSDGPAFYVCRHLAGVVEARYLFRAMAAGEEAERFPEIDLGRFLDALGGTVRRLHDAGFWHRDLSGGNVLIQPHGPGAPPALYLVDLNRTRRGRRPSLSERSRDLCRLAIFRRADQERLLAAYWEGPPPAAARLLYHAYQRAFLTKNRSKQAVRGATSGLVHWARDLVLPRGTHAHIPAAPAGAPARDRAVWDPLSDQPHLHAGKLAKLGVRLADARSHAGEAAAVARALPRIWRRYRALRRGLYTEPVPWRGAGVGLRPWLDDPEAPAAAVEELGVRSALLRLHPWEEDHAAEEELARELHRRGIELTFALPQNRELVRDPARWRSAVEEIAERFTPYGRHFQLGQAINRSKWGVWTIDEYLGLAEAAAEVLKARPGVEVLGPAVIDFELHATAAVLNLRRARVRFDAVASLLYVDRRGAPENRQGGFDTVGKVTLLKAIADTARNAAPRSWITEVNWPLREGPHSPAGRAVAVDEETQADYLARYYLLALGTGLVERVFWWQAIARGYGLVAPEEGRLRRRPSFRALQTLERQLAGTVFEGPIEAPEPARLYRFRHPDHTLVVGWSAAPGGAPAEAHLPAPATRAVGRDGDELPSPEGTAVRLTGSPVYLYLAHR